MLIYRRFETAQSVNRSTIANRQSKTNQRSPISNDHDHPSRHRVQTWPRTLRVDDGRRRLDDRLGHLSRLGGDGTADGEPRTAADGLDRHRWPDARRCALVRRTRGDDAARGRSVRVPARSLRAALGVPVRLDAVHGDPDRHHCGGGGRLRPLHGISAPVVLRNALPDFRRSISRPAMPCRSRRCSCSASSWSRC